MERQDCVCKQRPVGYRFVPTDQEICVLYLLPKFLETPVPCAHAITGEVDLYGALPWEIFHDDDPHWIITESPSSKDPSKEKTKIKKTIYAFTKLYDKATKSDEKGSKKNRTAGSGTWTMQNNNPVMNQGRIIGSNKYFGFYSEGSKKKRKNSDDQGSWSMHEYTLEGEEFKNYALCKITKEVTFVKKQHITTTSAVRHPAVSHVRNYQLQRLNVEPISVEPATGSNLQLGGCLNGNLRRNMGYNGRNQEQVINNIPGPVVSHVYNQQFHPLSIEPISACRYLNDNQRQNLGYNGRNQEAVVNNIPLPVLPVQNYQPNSTAFVVADGQKQYLGYGDHPHLVHVTDYEVHHYQSPFNVEPAASSLDSNNVHNNKSSKKAVLEENPQTVDDFLNLDEFVGSDDNIDFGFSNDVIVVEEDPQVPFNLETTDNQVGSKVVQELPVVEVNDQRNYLGDGDHEEVNPQAQESNVHDSMPSFAENIGSDYWSSELGELDYTFQLDDSESTCVLESPLRKQQ